MTASQETLFISDLHLSVQRPDTLELFKRLLQGPARQASALYILGDLFDEFWLGEDDRTPPNTDIISELLEFSRSGTKLYFLRGNRELVLDQSFTGLSGCVLLPDQALIEVDGKKVLIMHGDLLCSDDRKYQAFRRFVECPPVKKTFTCLPLRLRTMLSRGLKPAMQKSKMQKAEAIMDVNPSTVDAVMRAHQVTELIHGHTHRPGIHDFELHGTPARRIVLGDWYEGCQILVCKGQERELIGVSEYLRQRQAG
ncbi:MAG: UDP-2,3-diacylglucosamine diphosphatase [Gammaproteobacteria bacterium]